MWNGTRVMAESIIKGVRETNPTIKIQLLNAAKFDKNDIITEVFKSKAILVGSPTIGGGILSSMAEIMEMIRGMRFKDKKAAAFGCYGWSGESVKELNLILEKSKFELLNDGIRALWNPDDESRKKCVEIGKEIGLQLK